MAKHTIIYQSHFELINNLTDAQAGMLIKAIGLFGLSQEPTITDPVVMGIWMAIKRDFIIQTENYNKKCKTNQENGLKGGRPKTQTVITETQPNPQNLKDKDKDKEKEYSNTVYSKASRQETLANAMADTWEQITKTI